jgi:hypothetical protein
MTASEFELLPSRIFLDSSTLQTLLTYGEFVWEGIEISNTDRLRSIPNGMQNLEALRNIFLVNERAGFEFALSENTLAEVAAKKDSQYFQWAHDVLDYWLICLQEAEDSFGKDISLATKLDSSSFGYLGAGDRLLIKDTVALGCDAFLTMEQKLPKNSQHIHRKLGLQILTPIQHWNLLSPFASLYV